MKFIFIHGGPGLNSEPESNLIEKYFETKGLSIDFWNEPKNLSIDHPLNELKEDLKKFILDKEENVNLIGHSFGAKLLLETLPDVMQKVDSICIISPAIDMIAGEQYVFDMAQELLKKNDQEKAIELSELIGKLKDEVDTIRIEALKLAVASGYFMNYFTDSKAFETYFSYLQGDYAFNLENFLKVRPHINKTLPDLSGYNGKSIVFFGKEDPAFKVENELPILKKYLPEINVKEMEGMRHYPHIERKNQLLDYYFDFLNAG